MTPTVERIMFGLKWLLSEEETLLLLQQRRAFRASRGVMFARDVPLRNLRFELPSGAPASWSWPSRAILLFSKPYIGC